MGVDRSRRSARGQEGHSRLLAAGGSPTAGSARVIRLVARPKPISEAVALYAAARYHACLDALRGNDSLPAEILTARVLLRLAKFGSPDIDGAIDCSRRSVALRTTKPAMPSGAS